MQAAHSLLQILMIGLEDVRRSRLSIKERMKLDYYDSCDDPEELAQLEKVISRTSWSTKSCSGIVSIIGLLNAGLFIVARFIVMFFVIQVSLIIIFQSTDKDDILELVKNFGALIIVSDFDNLVG